MKEIDVDPVAPTIARTFARDVIEIASRYENSKIQRVIILICRKDSLRRFGSSLFCWVGASCGSSLLKLSNGIKLALLSYNLPFLKFSMNIIMFFTDDLQGWHCNGNANITNSSIANLPMVVEMEFGYKVRIFHTIFSPNVI